MLNLAIATDFVACTGSPEPHLRALGESGFTHLHWCHQWDTDFIYGPAELKQIKAWLRENGLKLLDIHGSEGREKRWAALEEYQRQAGVELVRNRLDMMQELEGTGALMMHVPIHATDYSSYDPKLHRRQRDALRRSLDELMPYLEKNHARIAIENLWCDTWEVIDEIMAAYPPECLGICYDSGHANARDLPQIDSMDARKDRLMALHLHDNNTLNDLHQPPFMGTVDWAKIARIIAESPYDRPLSFEISIRNTPYMPTEPGQKPTPENVRDFLADAYQRCCKLQDMVDQERAKLP